MKKVWKQGEEVLAAYTGRVEDVYTATLLTATQNMVGYFMSLGDDLATAQDKVTQMSTEVSAFTHIYTLGNMQRLIDAINASVLAHMDAPAKAYAVDQLTIPTV